MNIRTEAPRRFERFFLVAGAILLAIYGAALLHQSISSRFALWQFKKGQTAKEKDLSAPAGPKVEGGVDVSLWAEKRIQAYRGSLVSKTDAPLAVLQINKLRIEVPVFEGTDDLTLNRGVGRIVGSANIGAPNIGSATIGSAKPGLPGNIGIAGHRDGFFRGLKDIAVGDDVELITTKESATYIVDQIEIVSPSDVRVLQARSAPSITLVTCYPFYFVGDAPNRFIVHASLASEQSRVSQQSSTRIPSSSKVFNHN